MINLWTFLAIVAVVAIIVEGFNKSQKTKLRFKATDKQFNELESEIKKLRMRIENLEIIAVTEPDNFQDRARRSHSENPNQDPSEDNQRLVNELARKKQGLR
jgi:FtsZ-interacting cell division protein ZipA